MLSKSKRTVKNSCSYDPWGNSLAKTEAVANPWQFAAGYYDATTGLYKFGTRYYDPKLGRWTQQDPVGGSLGGSNSGNRYVYANDNPVMLTDPSGRFSIAGQCVGAIFSVLFTGGLGAFFIGHVGGAGAIGAAIAALIAAGPLGWVVLIGGAIVAGAISYEAAAFIYDNTIAPACGWENFPTLTSISIFRKNWNASVGTHLRDRVSRSLRCA